MKKDRIAHLRERYLSAKKNRKEPYFDADEIDDLLNSLEELSDLSLYEEILVLGLRLHPGNTALQIRQCRQLLLHNKINEALALIRQIGEKGNQDLDVLELECYIYLDDYAKVIELTEEIIARKVDYPEYIFEYITPILNDMDMFKEAVDYAERGLRLFPESVILKEELCFSLENTEDFDRAIAICNELIDQKPYSFDEWFALGRLYSYKGNFESAIEAFDFALTCDDSIVELKLLLAYCLSKNGNYKRALDICVESLPDEIHRERFTVLMAECYNKMNNHNAAYLLLKNLINESPETLSSSVYIQLMGCCIEMERYAEAYDLLLAAYSLEPNNPEILAILSRMPKDEKELEKLFAEVYDLMEKMLENDEFFDLEDNESYSFRKTDLIKDPRILTKSLAKEYIKNKDNSN